MKGNGKLDTNCIYINGKRYSMSSGEGSIIMAEGLGLEVVYKNGKVVYFQVGVNPDAKYFESDAGKAVAHLTSQLTQGMTGTFEGKTPAIVVGEGCVIDARALNPVMRSLEAVGLERCVWVTPVVPRGKLGAFYQLVPAITGPEFAVMCSLRFDVI